MFKSLVLLNKAGYVLAAATIALTALAYQPVSSIFSTNSGLKCQVSSNGRISAAIGQDKKIFGNKAPRSIGPLNVSIAAGEYNIYFQSYDNHSEQPPLNQKKERWVIEGRKNGSVQWVSVATPDVPENVDTINGLLQAKVTLPALDSVTFRHAENTGTESVVPVCAAFEKTEQPPVACELPVADGRIVNVNNTALLANGRREVGPFTIDLAAGKYDVSWQSWDSHSQKGGQGQTQEQWQVVYLKNGVEVATSAATADLPEALDTISGTFTNQILPMADQVIFRHAAPASAGPQSIVPTCVNFERQPDPVVVCDGLAAAKLDRDSFKFTASATASNGATISDYTIDFGDGNSTTTASGMAEHDYAAPGTYTVRATVNGSTGPVTSRACVTKVTVDPPEKVIDLELTKLVALNDQASVEADTPATGPQGFVDDTVTWTIVLTNKGPDTATGVNVSDVIPSAFTVSAVTPTLGSFSGSTWNVGSLNAGSSAELVVTTTADQVGSFVNEAQVSAANERDIDSTPNNGFIGEDDDNPAHVSIVKRPPSTATLGDRVWNDLNSNGIQDDGEPGVSGVTVILQTEAGNEVTRMNTNGNGNYLFEDLQPGAYKVSFEQPDGFDFTIANEGSDAADSDANQTTGMTQAVTLNAGDDNRTVDAGLVVPPQLAALGDRVWIDTNANGQQDDGEGNLAGFRVSLLDVNGSVVETQFTNGTGNYLFTDLQPGTYSVVFTQPNGYTFTTANNGNDATDSDANQTTGVTTQVTLAPGASNLTVDAGLVPVPVPVFTCDAIRVATVDNRRFAVQADFTIENTTVENYLFSVFSNTGVRTAASNDTSFSFTALESGNHVVTAQVKTVDGTSDIRDCQFNLRVAPQIDLELIKTVSFGDSAGFVDADTEEAAPTGTVGDDAQWTITVTNQGPDTATGVVVTDLVPADVTYVTHTLSTGTFNTSNAEWTVGTLAAGESESITLVTTVDAAGSIVNWAGVTDAVEEDVDSTPFDDIDGNEDDEDPAWVTSQEPQTASLGDRVWIDLNGNGLQDTDEPGIDGVVVILQRPDGTEVARETTANGGIYLFEDLKASDYKVTFEKPADYTFTAANAGDDAADSDADVTTGMSDTVTLAPGDVNRTVDVGLQLIETEEPIARCVALNVVKLETGRYRFEIASLVENATVDSYSFSVNGEVVKQGSERTMEFTALKPGTYNIDATVTVTIDDEQQTITCPSAKVVIDEPGEVLGKQTPTMLPNTGPGTVIGALGMGLAVFAAHSWLTSRRQLISSIRS